MSSVMNHPGILHMGFVPDQDDDHPQAARRSPGTMYDQHGRTYAVVIEQTQRSNHPTGPINPCAPPQFTGRVIGDYEAAQYLAHCREHQLWPYAPVMPPEEHLRPMPGDQSVLVVDYPEWRRRTAENHEAWWTWLTDAATAYYKDEAANVLDRIRGGGAVPRYLDRLVGSKPLDLRIIDTCAAGKSRWILGLPDVHGQPVPRPSWADDILPLPVFVEPEAFRDEPEAFADDETYDGEPETLEGAVGAPAGVVEQPQTMGDRMAHVRAQRRQKVA